MIAPLLFTCLTGAAAGAKTFDCNKQKQKQKAPDKRIQKDRKKLKPFREQLTVRVNPHTGIQYWKSEYECQVFQHSFYRTSISAWIEKVSLYH